VLPVASAQMLARSFRSTLTWSVAIGVGSVVVWLVASWEWNLAPSGAIVLVTGAAFGAISIGKQITVRARREVVRA
jgi:zinc transport system permease protein